MNVCFCCVRFNFFSSSQQIGWQERPRNGLFCVEWDVEAYLGLCIMAHIAHIKGLSSHP